MIPSRLFARRLFAAFVAFAAGCTTVGPDYVPPTTAVPAAFRDVGQGGLDSGAADLRDWWRKLDDTVLDQLVARAIGDGLDLRAAMMRVDEARALRGEAVADRWPTVDARAGYQRVGQSENTPLGGFAENFDQYTTGVNLSWEVDLWGRVRRSIEAADADVGQRLAAARDVAVAIAAETATNYVEFRSLQQRLQIARDNQTLQEQTLALVQARFEAGLVGERDVAQATSILAATRARIPSLAISLRAAENRLAVLVGQAPGALAQDLAAVAPVPAPPANVAVGVPTDAVRQRPDVRAAERALAAETARIGVAEGDLYPRLSLLGTVGFESDKIANQFDGASNVFAIGPSLTWNLFDAGRLRSRVEAQEARAQQALLAWQQTVLLALEQSENAMTAFAREQTRRDELGNAATQARRAVDLAQAQYREGLTDFQNVLDSERALVELEDQQAQSRAAVTQNLILLYRALGGGFDGAAAGQP